MPGSIATTSETEEPGRRARQGHAPGVAASRITRLFPLPAAPQMQRRPAWFGGVTALPLHPVARDRSARPESLIPPRAARGIVKALLASDLPDGTVDVDELIETLVRGRPLTRWPRHLVASLAQGASIVVDNGAQLAPFRPDIAGLVRMLRNIIGSERLTIHVCDGWPPDVVGAESANRLEENTAFAPPPRAPVLVISDLGLCAGAAGHAARRAG